MTKTIFRSMLAVSVTVLLLCVLCISCILYDYFGDIIKDELKVEASLVSVSLEKNEVYDTTFKGIKNRITLVEKDGTVL